MQNADSTPALVGLAPFTPCNNGALIVTFGSPSATPPPIAGLVQASLQRSDAYRNKRSHMRFPPPRDTVDPIRRTPRRSSHTRHMNSGASASENEGDDACETTPLFIPQGNAPISLPSFGTSPQYQSSITTSIPHP